jgi:WD40 repeat protein
MSANKFPSDPIGTLRGHLAAVHSVSFLNVTTLGSGSSDGIVKIWNLKTRREKASIQAHSKAGVLHVKAFGNQQVLTQGRDGYIHLWDQNTFGTDTQQKLNSFYCGSFSFTKFAIQRWDHGSSISTTNQQSLIVAPSSDSMSVS